MTAIAVPRYAVKRLPDDFGKLHNDTPADDDDPAEDEVRWAAGTIICQPVLRL